MSDVRISLFDRCFRVAAVSVMSIALFQCSGSPNQPGVETQSQTRPEWQIRLRSTCGAVNAENCIAGYFYSVGADGMFRVGPGPQGQIFSARLPDEDFALIQVLVSQTLSASRAHAGPDACISTPNAGSEDVIDWISSSGEETAMVRATAQDLCFRLPSPDLARELHALMRQSAERHYPLPFPDDACDGATASLDALYGNMRACESDADCSFFDDTLQAVSSDHLTFIVTGDCTGAKPLILGNRALVSGNRQALFQAITHARDACKKRVATACTGFSEFQPTRPAPFCSSGVCRSRSL